MAKKKFQFIQKNKSFTVKVDAFQSFKIKFIISKYDYERSWDGQTTPGYSDKSTTIELHYDEQHPLVIGVIAHEILHAIRYELCDIRGVKRLDEGQDETLPYVNGYVLEKVLRFLLKHNIEVKAFI